MQLETGERLVPKADSLANVLGNGLRTPQELADIVSLFALSEGWVGRVRLEKPSRSDERSCIE